MRKLYITRSFLLAALIALGAALPKPPETDTQRNADMGLEVSPVTVMPLDTL
ncbi:hypothetical protein [Roseovarius faecimaris]|uniref:hypothetical protein n=1 Tax=Roseovarius faecimaris TaxID=2494550 RepID=UPI0012FE7ABE|nr:hypothetical protein [Roseovarius faecimaris]